MLKALYDYGVRRQLALPPGFTNKQIRAYISLSGEGKFNDIFFGGEEPEPCPDIGSFSQSKDKCNVLAEKRSIILPDNAGPKSDFFMKTLCDAAEEEPLLKPCIDALNDPATAAHIKAALDNKKIKPTDRVSFRVNGRSVLKSENIRRWWQKYRTQFAKTDEQPTTLCLITGKPTVSMATSTPFQGLKITKEDSAQNMLVCFDKNAFCSYDQQKQNSSSANFAEKKAANAPISEEAFTFIKAALEDLLRDAPFIGKIKFVHWYDREIPEKYDSIKAVFEDIPEEKNDDPEEEEIPVNEAAMRANADGVRESVFSGECPPDLDNVSYYILLLTGVKSRVMIRRYERGNYADLRRNIAQWCNDLALTNPRGTGNIKSVRLFARLYRLMKFQTSEKDINDRATKELSEIIPTVIHAILNGSVLPDAVAAKALMAIRSELLADDDTNKKSSLPNGLTCQWLKVWLLRKNRKENKEEEILAEYNKSLSNTAYHCGGLMAVYAAIQKEAMPDVNTGIVERYYSSAIQMPALVIGQLSSRSNYHLEKIKFKKHAENYRKKLQEISLTLGTDIPSTLNLEQQSYFALGYYQMGALLNKERAEEDARRDAEKEETAKNAEEN